MDPLDVSGDPVGHSRLMRGSTDVLVGSMSEIDEPEQVRVSLALPRDRGNKIALRLLAVFSGGTLGALTALALAGVMVTPVGWALAGGILALTLIVAASRGGREFLKTLMYATGAFFLTGGLVAGFGPVTLTTTGTAKASTAAIFEGAIVLQGALLLDCIDRR